jgi:hypothetical protein
MTMDEVPDPAEVEAAAEAWRSALATLGPDRSVRDRDARKRAAGALAGGVAAVRAIGEGRS